MLVFSPFMGGVSLAFDWRLLGLETACTQAASAAVTTGLADRPSSTYVPPPPPPDFPSVGAAATP